MPMDQSTIASSDTAIPQPDPDDRLVDLFVRGGYPVDRDVMFSFACNISEHLKQRKPKDCEERGVIFNCVNDVLGCYEDVDCTGVGNPADPAGYTWIIATTPFKRVQVRRSELDNFRKDPWRPPSAFELQESPLDVDFKDYLAQNGVSGDSKHAGLARSAAWPARVRGEFPVSHKFYA
ncbi:uncharacterized protein SCHCODRAFT_02686310 [Schizophyllum commune H4-8]|uniref:uncharacterized protein n=1 Tax=Schizophyllum commune (strain H4-8 / FGSC 9210) TaxID=578458 RepID=UPI00215F2F0C|nr:uncharacterized protein SCHCODRAFT_02686310 [Schizophyllum commune H4-8]KAI5894767.1 hypothetical protein SCHCODRAFT_02686310 [Schizophyllum commune H4-8]